MNAEQKTPLSDGPSRDELVGRRVHMIMWDRKVSQTALAPRVGMIQSGLAKKLRGQRGWSLDDLYAVAFALDVTVPELLVDLDEHDGGDPEGQATPGAGAGRKGLTNLYRSAGSNLVELRPASAPLEYQWSA